MNIYIANLSKTVTSTDFWDIYSEIGTVREVEIVRSSENSCENDFAVIQLESFPRKKRNKEILAAAKSSQPKLIFQVK